MCKCVRVWGQMTAILSLSLGSTIHTTYMHRHTIIAGWLTHRHGGQGPIPAVAIASTRKERRGRPDPRVCERPDLLERPLRLGLEGDEGAGRAGQGKEGDEQEDEAERAGADGGGGHGFCSVG